MKTSQWIRPFFFTLLVVVVPLVGYYIYFVESQEVFLLERYHAHLANMATKTDARFESAASVVRINFGAANVLGLSVVQGTECERSLRDAQIRVERSPTRQVRFTRSRRTTQRAAESATEAPSLAASEPEGGAADPGALDAAGAAAEEQAGAAGDCVAESDPAELVGNVDPNGEFYDVIVLDANDRVIFQLAPEKGRITDGQLAFASQDEEDTGSAVSDPLSQMRITFHGRSFLTFREPLGVISGAAEGTWKIVGLLPESGFNRLKYAVRPGGIVLVAILVGGLLVAAPFLKLWYLGSFEPLTRFDICLQIGAGLFLVAMVTVSLLAWGTHNDLSRQFDQALGEIVDRLKQSFDEEIEFANTTLRNLEEPMIRAYRSRQRAGDFPERAANCRELATRNLSAQAWPSEQGGPTLAGDILQTDEVPNLSGATMGFRQLVMSYLMDQNGCQIVKWSSESEPPAPGPFADRPYFLRALPNERTPLRLFGDDPNRYFQQVIVSRTTGERRVAFSKPVERPGDCQEALREGGSSAQPCVAVITAELRSLESVLPAGFGAMLVDAQSNILLRSDGDDSTEINIADEVSDPDRLRAAIALAVDSGVAIETLLDAAYRGTPHRFRAVPLEHGEWALVAYYNRNLATATVLDAVAAAIVIWLVWVAIVSTVLIVAWLLDNMTERGLRRWLATPPAIGVVVLLFLLIGTRVPPFLMPAVAGIPLSLATAILLARKDSRRVRVSRVLAVVATWLAVMLVAAYPMWQFYESTEAQAEEALEGFRKKELVLAEAGQAGLFEEWKHKVGLGGDGEWTSFKIWDDNPIYPERDEVMQTDEYECAGGWVCFMLRRLPRFADGVSGMRAMYEIGRDDVDPEIVDSIRSTRQQRVVMRRVALTQLGSTHWSSFVVFGLLTAVGIWQLLVRTFSLRAENVVKVGKVPEEVGDTQFRYMLYGYPDDEKPDACANEISEELKLRLDMRNAPVDARIDVPAATKAVMLDYFDANLTDIEVVRQRVSLLERLLREERQVIVIFVSIDPLNFVTSVHDEESAGVLVSRFATVLSRFKLAYHQSADRKANTPSVRPVVNRTLVKWRRLSRSGNWKRLFENGNWRRLLEKDNWRRLIEKANWRRALVRAECRHPNLRSIKDELISADELDRLSKRQIVQQVQSRANAIYQHMWNQCTRIEKFTLMELARGNPINPNNWDAARRLRLRGYVVADPFYRIASESLRQFVARVSLQEDVHSWRAQSPGSWGQIKVPLLVLFIGALVFIAFTRPDLFNAFFAVMAAGAASFPFLVSALSARLQRSAKSGGS